MAHHPTVSRLLSLRLRGGDTAPGKSLTQDEIMQKLNAVPTFCIVDEDENLVNLQTDEGEPAVRFFIDAGDAQEALEMTVVGSPELRSPHLSAMPLGVAFTACGNSRPGARFVMQGPRRALDESEDEVRAQLEKQNIDPDGWLLPVYCADDFQTEQLFPLFFSKDDLTAGWVRAGKPESEAMFLITTVMDLRSLVLNMEHSDGMPWAIFQLVASKEAYALARELQAAKTGS